MRPDLTIGTALSGGLNFSAVFCSMLYLLKKEDISSFLPRVLKCIILISDIYKLDWARLAIADREELLNVVEAHPVDSKHIIEKALYKVGHPYTTFLHPIFRRNKAIKRSRISVILDEYGADDMFSVYNDLSLGMLSSYTTFTRGKLLI